MSGAERMSFNTDAIDLDRYERAAFAALLLLFFPNKNGSIKKGASRLLLTNIRGYPVNCDCVLYPI